MARYLLPPVAVFGSLGLNEGVQSLKEAKMLNRKRQISLWLKATVLAFGITVLIDWGGAQGERLASFEALSQVQPGLPVITVCPEGPPKCQFAKIQEAINAAPDGSSATGYVPPAEIWVAPGIYEENIVILKSVILKGAGRDQVILRPRRGGGRETKAIIVVVGSVVPLYYEISGFTLQQTPTGGDIGIHIVGGVGGSISNNRFQNSSAAIGVNGGWRLSIRDNLFERGDLGGSGIELLASINVEITENKFIDLTNDDVGGITIRGSQKRLPAGIGRILVARNTFQNLADFNIMVSDSAYVEIQENIIERGLLGVFLFSSDAVTIQGNSIRDNRAQGVVMGGSNAILRGNTVRSNGGAGIVISGSNNVTLQGNLVEENGRDGLEILGGSTVEEPVPAVQLLENQIMRNNRFGIWTERVEYVAVCKGNQVSENKAGDYGGGPISDPQPSPELKAKCEGG